MTYKKTKQTIFLTIITMIAGLSGLASTDCVYANQIDNNIEYKDTASNQDAESNLVYNFKDAKKEGTVTFVKKWKDRKGNENRPVPDIEISTERPRKNVNGYTVTYHSNGMTFADGSSENEMVFNSAMDIIGGQYKVPGTAYAFWYTEPECINKVSVSKDGIPNLKLTSDIDLYAKPVTFVLKNGVDFNKLIPDDVTEVWFTDEEAPAEAEIVDVDADNDDGVVAWIDNGVMKVSTQIEGIYVKFNVAANGMFSDKAQLTNIKFDNVDTSMMQTMHYMFSGCTGLTELDLSNFNTLHVDTTTAMFYGCKNLISINVSSFNTSNFRWTTSMFKDCNSLIELDVSKFDTRNITNMSDMFNGCKSLKSLDVSKWDTGNVTGFGYTFFNCSVLEQLDVSNWNTNKVTSFVGMFSGCRKLTELDVSKFNTSSATNIGEMFYSCGSLTNIDVSGFDTSKVTKMNHLFGGCGKLTSINVSNFNTENVTDMQSMFMSCSSLTSIDVSVFNTKNVTNMQQMFYGCSKITDLNLSSFITPKVTNICNMFNMCYDLTALDISNLDTSKVTNMNWTFSNLRSLKELTVGEDFGFVGTAYGLTGVWKNSDGEEFDAMAMPNNVADTYTKQ